MSIPSKITTAGDAWGVVGIKEEELCPSTSEPTEVWINKVFIVTWKSCKLLR